MMMKKLVYVVVSMSFCFDVDINRFNSKIKNTYDEEFEDFYSLDRIRHGDNSTYANQYEYMKIKVEGIVEESGEARRFRVFDDEEIIIIHKNTEESNARLVVCLRYLLPLMSKGEKVVIKCPPNHAYGSIGYNGVVKPGKKAVFEVEMIDPIYDLFKTVDIIKRKKSMLNISKDDVYEYKLDIYEKSDKTLETPIFSKVYKSSITHMFDCVESTIRRMSSPGDIAMSICPSKYLFGASSYDNIPANFDALVRVELLSLSKHISDEF